MTPELQEKLFSKYPRIFGRKDLDVNQTCMCMGIDCGDGWYSILDVLCSQIQNHLDWQNGEGKYTRRAEKKQVSEPDGSEQDDVASEPKVHQVQADQVKEKFGTLRFYSIGGADYTQGLIDMAEGLSSRTCEVCGAPGRQTVDGRWILTLCPVHAQEKGRTTAGEDRNEDDEDGEREPAGGA